MGLIEIINISHEPYNCTLVIIIQPPKHFTNICLSYPNYKLYEESNDLYTDTLRHIIEIRYVDDMILTFM